MANAASAAIAMRVMSSPFSGLMSLVRDTRPKTRERRREGFAAARIFFDV
jgi:hypothetical protein